MFENKMKLQMLYMIIIIFTSFIPICATTSFKDVPSNSKSNSLHYSGGSWKNLQLSRIINDELIKMLDKEEIFEKMYDLFQYDKNNEKLLNDVKEKEYEEKKSLKSENNEENQVIKKMYRDTFVDNIADHINIKRAKRELNNNEKRDTRLTGDTILHIKSEVSDVIKSERDLYDVFKQERKSIRKRAESYMDGIMIHPSKFIYNTLDKEVNKSDNKSVNKKTGDSKSNRMNEYNQFMNKRKTLEVSDDYDDSIKKKYGQVLKSKREFNENMQSDSPFGKTFLTQLNVKQVLECVLPDDVKVVIWYKDGKEVPIQGRMQITNEKHIVITEVTREDEGKWICSGKNSNGSLLRSDSLILAVLEAPSQPYLEVFGRRLDPSNLFLPVKEGSELKLTCKVESGRPLPTLYWYPAPTELQAVSEQDPEFEGVSISAELLIRRDHHNMSISCVADHAILEEPLIASTLLHVQYAPRFSISRIPGFGFPLAEGSAAALKCEVDSNPPSAPHWRRDETDPPVPQSDDGFLNFTSVLREHSGWYKCIANHILGNYSSIGYFLNVRYEADEVTKLSTDIQQVATKEKVEVALGGAVQLQCPPESFGCWGRPSSKMEVGTPPGISREAPSPAIGILYKEAGQFKCKGIAKHDAERLKILRNSNIIQDGPAVYPTNETINVIEGQLALFQVEVCSSPPLTKLIWLTPDHLLHIGSSFGNITAYNITDSTRPECVWAKLAVENARIRHTGEYSLVARSSYGLREALLQLTVQPNASAITNSIFKKNSSKSLHFATFTHLTLIVSLFIQYYINIF